MFRVSDTIDVSTFEGISVYRDIAIIADGTFGAAICERCYKKWEIGEYRRIFDITDEIDKQRKFDETTANNG